MPTKPLPSSWMNDSHVLLLAVIHVQLAGGAGKDQKVEIIQVLGVVFQFFFGQQLGVGAQGGVPQPAFLAHVVDGGHGGRDGVVLQAFGLRDHQHMLEVDLPGVGRRLQRNACGRLRLNADALAEDSQKDEGWKEKEDISESAHLGHLRFTFIRRYEL